MIRRRLQRIPFISISPCTNGTMWLPWFILRQNLSCIFLTRLWSLARFWRPSLLWNRTRFSLSGFRASWRVVNFQMREFICSVTKWALGKLSRITSFQAISPRCSCHRSRCSFLILLPNDLLLQANWCSFVRVFWISLILIGRFSHRAPRIWVVASTSTRRFCRILIFGSSFIPRLSY